jgi:hypothetical protein
MKVIPGRVLDLQVLQTITFSLWVDRDNFRVHGGLNFRVVIFDGYQPASHIVDHNGLNGHSIPLLWGYQAETTLQYSPETPLTHDI